MKQTKKLLLIAVILLLNIVTVSAAAPYPSQYQPKPVYDENLYPYAVLYDAFGSEGAHYMYCQVPFDANLVPQSELTGSPWQGQTIYQLYNGTWTAGLIQIKEWNGSAWVGNNGAWTEAVGSPSDIIWTNQTTIMNETNGSQFYPELSPLEVLNSKANESEFTSYWMGQKSYFGITSDFDNNYTRYTIGRQSRINQALYAAKPYDSINAFQSKFQEQCSPIYELIGMPGKTIAASFKNTTAESILFTTWADKANLKETWTDSSGTVNSITTSNLTTIGEHIELEPGETVVYELLNPIDGGFSIRYEKDIGLFVIMSSLENQGDSTPGTTLPTQPIEEVKMPQAPNKANYENSVWGSMNYSLDCILYWVGYPFIALNYLSQRFVVYMQSLMNNVGQMNNVMKSAVAWLPPELVGVLILGVITSVVLKILGR